MYYDYSGLYLELVNYERLYEKNAHSALLLNDFDLKDPAQKDKLDSLLYTMYQSDSIDTIPSCECGAVTKNINLGVICNNCGYECLPQTEKPMRSILWAKVPPGVKGFISPNFWNIFNSKVNRRKTSVLNWLVSPYYKPPERERYENDEFFKDIVEDLGWKRNLNHFIDNFDEVISYMFNYKPTFICNSIPEKMEFYNFIMDNKDKVFTKYLPIPNKAIFIAEQTATGIYIDKLIHNAIDATRTMASIDEELDVDVMANSTKAIKIISQLADFYKDYDKGNLAGKPGTFRQNILGARFDFSGRAVITSIPEKHEKDELHLPWGMGIQKLKVPIMSKLLKLGYPPKDIEKIIKLSIRKYNPLIDEILRELISLSKGWRVGRERNGIPCLFQRNPSLERGSAQGLRVTKIKTDLSDPTVSLSQLVLDQFNADFDGDEMNSKIIIDIKEVMDFSRLRPDLTVMDTAKPFSVSGAVKIPNPTVFTIYNWLADSDGVVFNQ